GKTSDTADQDSTSGALAFTDANWSDTHKASETSSSVTWSWSNGSSSIIPGATATALASAMSDGIVTDSQNGAAGTLGWNFSAPDNVFDFLAAGEMLTITYNLTVTDSFNATSTTPVTIVVTGTDDTPTYDLAHSAVIGTINALPGPAGNATPDYTSGLL